MLRFSVAGGASGFLFVEEDFAEEKLPNWLKAENTPTHEMLIQHFELKRIECIGKLSNPPDDVFKITNSNEATKRTEFYLVNGEYVPDICLGTKTAKDFASMLG